MKKISRFFIFTAIFAALFSVTPLWADEINSDTVSAELKAIQATQQEILKEIAEIKAEIQIIKVRVTINT